jgi:hypothetical protein
LRVSARSQQDTSTWNLVPCMTLPSCTCDRNAYGRSIRRAKERNLADWRSTPRYARVTRCTLNCDISRRLRRLNPRLRLSCPDCAAGTSSYRCIRVIDIALVLQSQGMGTKLSNPLRW